MVDNIFVNVYEQLVALTDIGDRENMEKPFVQDMTKGSELVHLITFAVPMLVGNLFQQFYNMVDSVIVGKYVGANALAAVGATGSLNFLFFSLCMGMAMGIGILVSQYFGAGEEKLVKKTIANAIYIMLVVGIMMSILGIIFARPILILLRTPAEILEDSTTYMKITCAGIIAIAAYNAISSILRALGDSKTPLIFLVFASFVNIILDLVFVLRFHMGVAGVAYATIIAQLIASIGSAVFAVSTNPYFRLTKDQMSPDKMIIMRSIRIGIPVAAQNSLIAVSCVALQVVVNGYGANVVAAFTATSRIEQLIQQPFGSMGAAESTFTGQNIGARKIERVKRGFYRSVLISLLFSILMLFVMWIFGEPIMRLFVNESEVILLGKNALRITSTMYFSLGLIYVTRGLLNGAGDSFFAMLNGIIELIGRVFFPTLLCMIPVIGVWGVWWATGLTWTVTAIVTLLRYRTGRWKEMSAVVK